MIRWREREREREREDYFNRKIKSCNRKIFYFISLGPR